MASLMKKLTVRKSKSTIENSSSAQKSTGANASSNGASSVKPANSASSTNGATSTTATTTTDTSSTAPTAQATNGANGAPSSPNAASIGEGSPTQLVSGNLWSPPTSPTAPSNPSPPLQTLPSAFSPVTTTSPGMPSASSGNYTNVIRHPDPAKAAQHGKVLKEFKDLMRKCEVRGFDAIGLNGFEPGLVASFMDAVKHTDDIDDRKFLLEHILVLLSKQPTNSEIEKHLGNFVVTFLYHDLQHPPATYISDKYAWRSADGSSNNINVTDMGKSFTPYSRSVQQVHPLPASDMPDAGLVFDALLKRRDGSFVPHPAGLSSMMFNFAALVIHTCFRTSHTDWSINETSSYVDLSPLYGVNQEQQDKVRDKASGRGLLKKDTFAEDRLLLLPPAVCVLLVLFNRNHNYIATQLLQINERQSYTNPSTPEYAKLSEAQKKKQDESLFQTARLINCGWFASVVFSDYLAAILGLVREGSSWSLDPFEEMRTIDHEFVGRGEGNSVSVEFNCLYRWHATTSVADEKWNEQLFKQIFKDKTYNSVSPQDFRFAAKELQKTELDCAHWTFGDLKRGDDGSFNDSQLAAILMDATSHPAHAFGARSTPPVMRLNEIMGIEQARKWGVCSLNDFRHFLGLKKYESFEEWNPDKEIAFAASKLYNGDINNLELYVGLQAEETKPLIPGAGLCPGYTISRAILADAIALTRGDRFFTTDMTPYNYTAWGLKDCTRDPNSPGFGSMLGKLFLRTLGSEYVSDSVFTWFPLHTPDAMKVFLTKLEKEKVPGVISSLTGEGRYGYERPSKAPKLVVVKDYTVVKDVLKTSTEGGEGEKFKPVYSDRVGAVVKGKGFFLANTSETSRDSSFARSLLLGTPQGYSKHSSYLHQKLLWLLEKDAYYLTDTATKNFDAGMVLKAAMVWWVADAVAGIQIRREGNAGLSTDEKDPKEKGVYTDKKLYEMLRDIYSFIFFESDPAHEINLEERARNAAEDFSKHVKSSLRPANSSGNRLSFIDTIQHAFDGRKKSVDESSPSASATSGGAHEFLEGLMKSRKNTDELTNTILSVAVGSSVELSQAMINMINLYLGHHYEDDRKKIEELVARDDPESEGLLMGYAREALRLDPPFVGIYREAKENCAVAGLNVTTSDRLFLSIYKANRDENIFPNAHIVDPTRPAELYLLGDGPNTCLGAEFCYKMLAQALRTFFSLKNLRRAPGMMGKLKRYPYTINGTDYYQYLDTNQTTTPWATTLYLQYDS